MVSSLPAATYEVLLGGQWVDVTAHVRQTSATTVKHGKSAESNAPQPAMCSFTLNNGTKDDPHDRYNPRNPMSPYFGQLVRNAPCRVYFGDVVDTVENGLGINGPAFATPISALGGDVDVRVKYSWAGPGAVLATQASPSPARFWFIHMDSGHLRLIWLPGTHNVDSTVPLPATGLGVWVRATLDINNGASGHTVAFYTATSNAGPWTQLGASVVIAGVTSTVAGSGGWYIGQTSNQNTVHAAEIRSAIGGTVVANPDFTAEPVGIVDFTDAAGRNWTIGNIVPPGALYTETARFAGEIESWEPRWNENRSDCRVPIQASGLLRRIDQAQSPVRNALRSWMNNHVDGPDTLGYWPLEDNSDTYTGMPDIGDVVATVTANQPSGQVFGKGRLTDWLDNTIALYPGGRIDIPIDIRSVWNTGFEVSFMFQGGDDDQVIDLIVDCATYQFKVTYDWAAAGATVTFPDGSTVSAGSGAGPSFLLQDGGATLCQFRAVGNLAVPNISYRHTMFYVESGSVSGNTGVVPTAPNLFPLRGITIASRGTSTRAVSIGHVAVHSVDDLSTYGSGYAPYDSATGRPAEYSVTRFRRLCAEQGVPFGGSFYHPYSARMGRQFPGTFLDLLELAERTDGGILRDARGNRAIEYISLHDLYDQAAVDLSYADGQIAPPLQPVDDDRYLRNDILAKRSDGGEYRAVRLTGPMSIQDPAEGGVGRYDSTVELNTKDETGLALMAEWQLNKGTLDVARYVSVTVNLRSPAIGDTLYAQLIALQVGERLRLTNMQEANVYAPVDLMVIGYSEEFTRKIHTITFTCVPEHLYHRWQTADATRGRLPSGTSALVSDVNSTATSLSVSSVNGRWTTASGDRPFDILVGGERMTVTNVTGASSPQSFTVTRSINGVVKAQTADTTVELADPYYLPATFG
jgi:hypothetical protein